MRKRSSWLLTCSTAGAATMFTAVVKERGSPPDLAKIAAVLKRCQVDLAEA